MGKSHFVQEYWLDRDTDESSVEVYLHSDYAALQAKLSEVEREMYEYKIALQRVSGETAFNDSQRFDVIRRIVDKCNQIAQQALHDNQQEG